MTHSASPLLCTRTGATPLWSNTAESILFDTGNNPEILAHNAEAKGIDLSKLDFVVLSHRHGDHMGGLAYVLKVNPKVTIYAPKEGFGVYGSDLQGILSANALIASVMQEFSGNTFERLGNE